MICSKCGKENQENAEFCAACGEAFEKRTLTEEFQHYRKEKKKKGLKRALIVWGLIGIGALIYFVVKMFSGSTDYASYSDNVGTDVPIMVNSIEKRISDKEGYLDFSFEVENQENKEYSEITFAMKAWNEEGKSVPLLGEGDTKGEYIYLLTGEGLSALATEDFYYAFESDDIKYVSVFCVACTDEKGKEWENPIYQNLKKIEKQNLSDTKLDYFTFEPIEENPSAETFIGITGDYICVNADPDSWTGRIFINEINEKAVFFDIAVLDYDGPQGILMSGVAEIVRDDAAVYEDEYGFSIGFVWDDEETMYVDYEGELTGTDSGIVMDVLENRVYYRDPEFNQ